MRKDYQVLYDSILATGKQGMYKRDIFRLCGLSNNRESSNELLAIAENHGFLFAEKDERVFAMEVFDGDW